LLGNWPSAALPTGRGEPLLLHHCFRFFLLLLHLSNYIHEFSRFYSPCLVPCPTTYPSQRTTRCSPAAVPPSGQAGKVCPRRVTQPIPPPQGEPKSSPVVTLQAKARCGHWSQQKQGPKLIMTSTSRHMEKIPKDWKFISQEEK